MVTHYMTEMSTLRQVQWVVSSYSKKNLHRNDDYDEILGQIDWLIFRLSQTRTHFRLDGNVTHAANQMWGAALTKIHF
ncbi:hypothetical protein L916_18478 [Phytophthora nicotianae]|uniref:Uncharacterized protein n=1 Tax=Phytophthora nicotianae TaxID=4792 RepID=W2I435_PHYNI|nr:hypothetical protein L916_18478 [Phytophthora nicotianae]